jgi:hypothetical protein
MNLWFQESRRRSCPRTTRYPGTIVNARTLGRSGNPDTMGKILRDIRGKLRKQSKVRDTHASTPEILARLGL